MKEVKNVSIDVNHLFIFYYNPTMIKVSLSVCHSLSSLCVNNIMNSNSYFVVLFHYFIIFHEIVECSFLFQFVVLCVCLSVCSFVNKVTFEPLH